MRPAIAALSLSLCVTGISEAEIRPDSTRWAVGLTLPKMEKFSLWRVNPRIAHGIVLTTGVSFYRVPFPTRYERDDGDLVVSENNWSTYAEFSYVCLRLRPVRKNVAPFGFYGVGGAIRNYDGERRDLSMTVRFGFGITWKPLTSVEVLIRQRFLGYFNHLPYGQRHDRNRVLRDYWSRSISFSLTRRPEVTVLFRF